MPFKHGKSTSVYLNALDLSAYLNAADFSADVDTADTSTFGNTWKTFIAGQASAKVGFQGLYDPTQVALPALLGVDPTAVLTYAPAGALAIGDRARLVSVGLTGYAEASPIGGAVALKWDVMASGTVGFGDALHILTVDTGTTTGAEKDDLAATATGWIAHLHVTAMTGGGTWTVKLQDAAVTNTYSDVAAGAFNALAVAGSQRLTSATTTTSLRRFVRYVATVAGGASPTITFALAYARNS